MQYMNAPPVLSAINPSPSHSRPPARHHRRAFRRPRRAFPTHMDGCATAWCRAQPARAPIQKHSHLDEQAEGPVIVESR